MRAYVATLGGRPVAIGGIVYSGGMLCAFSDMKDEFRPYKMSIVKFARRIGEIFNGLPGMAIAAPDEPGADRLLVRLGFEHVGTTEQGEVYRWAA